MFLIFTLLISLSTFAQNFTFPKHDFDYQKNRFGIDHSFTLLKNGNAKYVLTLLKVKKSLGKNLDDELKSVIEAKSKSKKSPWTNSQILQKSKLAWNPTQSGILAEVSFNQNNLPRSALIGLWPAGNSYYFIYTSTETLEFNQLKQVYRKFIQDIRFGL